MMFESNETSCRAMLKHQRMPEEEGTPMKAIMEAHQTAQYTNNETMSEKVLQTGRDEFIDQRLLHVTIH